MGKLMVMEKWCAFQRMKAFLYGYLKGKFEGKTTEINDFACVLKEIIKLMDDKLILSQERYLEILQKIKEKRVGRKINK